MDRLSRGGCVAFSFRSVWSLIYALTIRVCLLIRVDDRSLCAATIKGRVHRERGTLGGWASSNKHRAERHRRSASPFVVTEVLLSTRILWIVQWRAMYPIQSFVSCCTMRRTSYICPKSSIHIASSENTAPLAIIICAMWRRHMEGILHEG